MRVQPVFSGILPESVSVQSWKLRQEIFDSWYPFAHEYTAQATVMHILTLPIPEAIVFRKMELLAPDQSVEIVSNICQNQWLLTILVNELIKDSVVQVDLSLGRVAVEGDSLGSWVYCRMPIMPRIQSRGDWLLGIGTKLANLASSVITMPQISFVLENKMPGFMAVGEDVVLPVPQGRIPAPLRLILSWGFSFELIPWKPGWFLMEIHFNGKGNPRG